jgi:hypothetical protein
MHLLMLSEAAVPVLAGLFLDITSPVLLLMAGAFPLHEATALWDVTYASQHRTVTPVEQHVHSYLEMVPLMALSFVAVLHWSQILAFCGVAGYRRDWGSRRKPQALPMQYVAPMLVAMVVLDGRRISKNSVFAALVTGGEGVCESGFSRALKSKREVPRARTPSFQSAGRTRHRIPISPLRLPRPPEVRALDCSDCISMI